MTDLNDNTVSAADTFAALRAGRASHPATRVRASDGYDGARAHATVAGAVLEAGDAEAIAVQRAAAGVSLSGVDNDIHALSTRIAFLTAKLNEGRHDSNGVFSHAIKGDFRNSFETDLASLTEELGVANQTRTAVLVRQQTEAARQRVKDENDFAESDFANGDPRRAEALKKAKLRLEADQMAKWLMARQYGA